MPTKNPPSDPTLMHFINNLRLVLNMDEIPGTSKGDERSRRERSNIVRFHIGEYSMAASRGFGLNGMKLR